VKIIKINQLKEKLKELKRGKIVLIGGCFDLFHFGHLDFLKKAKAQGNYLIVLLESDSFIKRIKKRNSIHTQNERAEILSSLEMVDLVVLLPFLKSDLYYQGLVKLIKPDIIAVATGDIKLNTKMKQASLVGAKIKQIPLVSKFSSSKIICNYF